MANCIVESASWRLAGGAEVAGAGRGGAGLVVLLRPGRACERTGDGGPSSRGWWAAEWGGEVGAGGMP